MDGQFQIAAFDPSEAAQSVHEGCNAALIFRIVFGALGEKYADAAKRPRLLRAHRPRESQRNTE